MIVDPDEIVDPDKMQAAPIVDPDSQPTQPIVDPDMMPKKGKWSTQKPLPKVPSELLQTPGMIPGRETTIQSPQLPGTSLEPQAPPSPGTIGPENPAFGFAREVLQRAGITTPGRQGLNPLGSALSPLTLLPAAAGVGVNRLSGETNRVEPGQGPTAGDIAEQLAYLTTPMRFAMKGAEPLAMALRSPEGKEAIEKLVQTMTPTRPMGDLAKTISDAVAGIKKPTAEEFAVKGIGEAGRIPVPPELETAGRAIATSLDEVKAAFAPAARGETGKLAAASLRENLGTRAQASDRVGALLDSSTKALDKVSPDINYALYDAAETGNTSALNNKFKPIVDAWRAVLDPRQRELVARGKLEDFNQNYLPHIYDFNRTLGRATGGTIRGTSQFLNERTYDTLREARDAGLTPATTNASKLVYMRAQQIDKYLAGLDTRDELIDKGVMRPFRDGSKDIPDGWVKVEDPIGKWEYRNEAGEQVHAGSYYMPEDGARIIHNYLAPGLNQYQLFRGYRGFNNLLNNFQLGFSGFHLGFTGFDTMISKMALGMDHLAHGELGKAASALNPAAILTSPATTFLKGNEVRKAWFDSNYGDPMLQKIVTALRMGGGRVSWDNNYRTQITEKMMTALKSSNPYSALIGGVGRSPFAAMEQLSRPLMAGWVPRVKLGVAYDLLRAELERNPGIGHDQMRDVAIKVWNSVDNRMGEMVYDNLFWNKTMKDLGFASIRSLGWNIGTVRELVGGIKDTGSMIKALATGSHPEFTYRMGYTLSLPVLIGTMGAISQYMMTGKGPESLKDYFFPRTGRVDERGREERISYPSYMKDIGALRYQPITTIANKTAPGLNIIADTLMNKDFYGGQIRNLGDPFVKQATDYLRWGANQFVPMGIQQMNIAKQRGGGVENYLPMLGVTPSPAYITETPTQRMLRDLKQTKSDFRSKMKRAKSNDERQQLLNSYQETIRNLTNKLGKEQNAHQNR